MSLDSVALIVGYENYFGIQIPDRVAEKISTVQDAVDCISGILNISDNDAVLKDKVFTQIQTAIIKAGYTSQTVSYSDLISNIFAGSTKKTWQDLSGLLNLKIEPPINEPGDSFTERMVSKITSRYKFKYNELTFSQLTDAVCGLNYLKLTDAKKLKSKYEVYVAIIGITVEQTGVSMYEVSPEKTFVNDFGID